MENASKALIIAGAILISILIISIGIYLYSNSGSMAILNANASSQEMLIMKFNKEYTMYEGNQRGTAVKRLLSMASTNNAELYQRQDTIPDCVCIRTKSKDILNQIKDSEVKRGLTTREYGVRYPNNISDISNYIKKTASYNISFNYNQKRLYLGNLDK